MTAYTPPVDKLLTLGRPDLSVEDPDYSQYGIGEEHIPELIRLLLDDEAIKIEVEDDEEDPPQWYAQIHAWRALGQLRATEAIEPLLDVVAENALADEGWSDWVTEEVPETIARIGPQALPHILERLKPLTSHGEVSSSFAHVLKEIAVRHPETRAEVVAELSRMLESAAANEPTPNGFFLAYLLDLKAVEAWPTIERAFTSGNIDTTIAGDLDEAKWQLGLGPEPKRVVPTRFQPLPHARLGTSQTNAKQRFNERQRKKKLEKKNKKKRK